MSSRTPQQAGRQPAHNQLPLRPAAQSTTLQRTVAGASATARPAPTPSRTNSDLDSSSADMIIAVLTSDLAILQSLLPHLQTVERTLASQQPDPKRHLALLQGELPHIKQLNSALSSLVPALRSNVNNMKLEQQALQARVVRFQRQAREDPLTGLPNRRAFEAVFTKLLMPGNALFSMAILDLDHFKRINDDYSHTVGDAVLKALGGILRGFAAKSRAKCHAFRWGGEEFALIIEGVNVSQAKGILDGLCASIAQEASTWEKIAKKLRVTASIGVADSIERRGREVLEEADARVYAAKGAGRNRVVGGR